MSASNYLCASGRAAEAGALVVHAPPGRLDARALELLDEIRQHPDDDGPRLVFADHVANVFPEHTAVLVAQCSGALADDLVRAFVATLPEWLQYEPTRGFVDGPLYVPAEHFVTGDPDVLYRVAPTCRTLHLQNASGFVAQLVTMPALRRYANLSFTDTYLFGGGAEQLARCEHLEHLEHLGLYATSMDDDDLLAIVRSTAYPRLHGLEIGNGREEQDYSLAAFQALADAVFAPTLRMLGFAKRWFGDDAVEVLAKLPALVQLDMASAALTDHGAAELAELPCRLTSLDLHHNDIGLAGARALAASPVLAELTRLELASNPLGDAGAAAIATSPQMTKLASLSLSGGFNDGVGPATAEALAGGTIARSLETLNLSLAQISTAGAQALARGTFPRLQHLDLYGNRIGDAGLVALARAPFISQLRGLNLGDNQIGSTGAAALCDADTHPELFVELGGAEVSEAVNRRLAERFGDRVRLEYPWNRLR